ncbi:MAG TPA: response regulator [Steroidobacteraceae bacterium]|nr:response regulator [Steroidobacteraceae bacterium]
MEEAGGQAGLRVLLVEDSPRIAERLCELLTQQGLRVLATVEDEPAAVRALHEMQVDVLILDLQLKVGTGFGVLEALGADRPPTIVMTNYALPQYRERALQLGVDYFLNKEKDLERLPEILAGIRTGHH